jgi:AcrR family transcriptional regulator
MSGRNPSKQILLTVPKPVLPPRKSERTREAILDSALEFLWTRPFRDLTVGELMSGTGSSRSAFYQYFTDLHDLMEALLRGMKDNIFAAAAPWLQGEGDPIPLLRESLAGLVQICYQRGPILRAVCDAASSDENLERTWAAFLKDFDDAVAQRIEQQQAMGLGPEYDAYPVAVALNRMDASLMIQQFGRRPRANPDAVLESITRIWISTLYGAGATATAGKSGRKQANK